ncbi:MAG: hypothetical protein WDM86_14995 [Rhizomicrobium sp.]
MTAVKSIDAVQSHIRELEAELAADTRLQELAVWKETERKLLAINTAPPKNAKVLQGFQLVSDVPLPLSRKGKQPKGRVAQHEAARLAVINMGHPLQTGELVGHMPRFGADISGPNAERNLTSILSKRGDLVSVRWRGKRAWWTKGVEVPD